MRSHQDLFKNGIIQGSIKCRLNRERAAIRAKDRNDEFLSRRNITVSPSKFVEVKLGTDSEEPKEENARTPSPSKSVKLKLETDSKASNKENARTQTLGQTLRIAQVAGKTSSDKFTRQEKFLQRFVEWKEAKKQQDELKKKQRERQKKPFVPTACAAIGVTRNATAVKTYTTKGTTNSAIAAKEVLENITENTKELTLKKRKSLYTIVSMPLRKKDEEKGAIAKKLPPPRTFLPDFSSISSARPVIAEQSKKSTYDVVNLKPVSERLVSVQPTQSSKQTPVAVSANKPKACIVKSIRGGGGSAKMTSANVAVAPTKDEVAPAGGEVASIKAAVATTKTLVVPTKTQARATASSANAVVAASATTRSAASAMIEDKPRAQIVQPIRGGEAIAQAKAIFTYPLLPSVKTMLSAKPQARVVKPVHSGDGATGKAKKHTVNKRAEELPKNSKLSVCMKAKKPSRTNGSTTRAIKNMPSKLKLNEIKLLAVPHEGLPVAETPTALTNINPFGFFVTSTKLKSNANNFNFMRSSETLKKEESFKFVVNEKDDSKKEVDEIKKSIQKPKTDNCPTKNAKKLTKPAKPSIALEQMMHKIHTAMRKNKAIAASSSSASGDTDIILTPSSKRKSKSGTPQHSLTFRRNSTPHRNSLIVKDKKFYSVAPTILIRQHTTPEMQGSPKQLKHLNGLTNSLKNLEKVHTRNELLKSALKGAEKQRFSFTGHITPTSLNTPFTFTAQSTSPSLHTPIAVKARKSILKTPGTVKGKPKNVNFSELNIKKFKFTVGSDDSSDEELEGKQQEISMHGNGSDDFQQRMYHLRGRKVLLRPSSEFQIPR